MAEMMPDEIAPGVMPNGVSSGTETSSAATAMGGRSSALSRPAPRAMVPTSEVFHVPDLAMASEKNEGFKLAELWQAVLRRRRLALVVSGVALSLSTIHLIGKRITSPVYEGSFQMLISDPISSAALQNQSNSSEEGGIVESLARNRTSANIPTLKKTLTSSLVLDPLREKLGSASGPLDQVTIGQPDDGRKGSGVDGILQVSVRGKTTSEVKQALGALSTTYLDFALTQRQERLAEGLRFLEHQEPVLTARVNELQGQLAVFRQQNNLLAPEVEAGALKNEAMGLEGQQRNLSSERTRLLALRQGVASGALTAGSFSTGSDEGNGNGNGNAANGVTVTQASSDRLSQLQKVEGQLAEARATYRGDSQRVSGLETLRDRLMAQLRSEQLRSIDTALALNATRIATVEAQKGQVDRQFLRQPQLIKRYEELQQQLKVAQENLASFLTTRSTFQLEQAQNTVPWKIIAPPSVTSNPVEPQLGKGMLQGLLLAAVLGIGAALLRDRMDHVYHQSSEVREDLKEPLLGSVPYVAQFEGVREDGRFVLEDLDKVSGDGGEQMRYQRFYYQEALRNLYTSLRFLNTDRPLRSVALTSSQPAEGKSLVNVLLAKTLSDLGQRVLLVDGDLRKPQLHYRLGVDNLSGLSNLLSGDAHDWRQVIQPVPGYGNWWVLTAGRRPPDPARLLSSQRMSDLVAELAASNDFDLILYDTPPALGLADAALIAEHLDGLMLLVSIGRVDRSLPKEAIERMIGAGVPLLGIVTNALKPEEDKSSRYGYRYGRYGRYGYGAADYRVAYAYYGKQDDDIIKSSSSVRQQRWRKLWTWLDG